MIDENDFFREATLRICGSLDVEKALWQCLLYLKNIIPAYHLSLHLYDPGLGMVETVAYADLKAGRRVSIKNALPSRVRRALAQRRSTRIWHVETMGEYEGTREIARKLNILDSAGIIMDLVVERNFLGTLIVANDPSKAFTQKDVRLMNVLNQPFAIALANSMRYRELTSLKDMLADESRYFQNELRRLTGEEVIGSETGLRAVMQMVRQVAGLDSPVLVLGETGVGKELIAGAIHNFSSRRKGPLIRVNCGAIPETLMDSELFGHEKGAFTGAVSSKRGRFERSHGGTIFLDEIGELSPEAQVRLLRVLQEKEIERVGGTNSIKLDIRVIAATHRNLEELLAQGRFRQDLYFRLKVFPITIPPLRQRRDDIPALVHHFIHKKAREMKLGTVPNLAPGVIERLVSYDWPGNVRELENAVERALILGGSGLLEFDELEQNGLAGSNQSDVFSFDNPVKLDSVVADHIRKVLNHTSGKVHGDQGAAELLGINPSTLRHRMRRLGIPFGRKKSVDQ
ncbi:MAG: AAA domain-containing protein [Desulfobacteraceae bacterium]|nr:AAA domain-containing protein [Desulfobacteraceae bacterium]